MAITLTLTALTFPDGTEFPGTIQGLQNLQAQYYEITGLETFNGINYGATTPDAENRDKPWYRLDNSDVEMGWYAWDGADWVLLPARVNVGTKIQRDAIATPFEGQLYFVTGSSALTIYDGVEWKPVIPTAARFHYDASYLYPQHQLLASVTSEVTTWTAIDLTSYIAAAGLDAEDADGNPKYEVKAAMVRVEIAQGKTGLSNSAWDASVRVSSSDSGSTTATDVLQARAFMATDDSATAVAATTSGYVPPKVGTNNIYYTVVKATSETNNLSAKVWLTGLLYTTTDAYFS